ncbi:hypothetical protein SETIT_2G230300v2 [Setaria italica]|uniref:alpha-amylase n=1 Tax=Setaria italica TaxID=4555 RepID=K4A2I5_SETIT|nr:hypothetical protein SETIT_2G230300v2 [Setaria italica]
MWSWASGQLMRWGNICSRLETPGPRTIRRAVGFNRTRRACYRRRPAVHEWRGNVEAPVIGNGDASLLAASPVHHNKLDPVNYHCVTHSSVCIQFYDHVFDWNLKQEISTLSTVRSRNGIHVGSKLDILAADGDLYVAKIDDKVIVKIGSGYDIGNLIPRTSTPLPMATTIGRRVV